MEKKKETKAQLERRMKNALVFVPRDKDTLGIFFDDKGVRLEVTQDVCVISTSFHRHVFSAITPSGYSRPYLYTKRIIEIALENDCVVGNGYSFARLLGVLNGKEDKTEYNIVVYYSWWLHLIFDNLYAIGESEVDSWIVFFKYACMLSWNNVLLEERKDDLTNKGFVEKFIEILKVNMEGVEERVLLKKMSDDERVQKEMEALRELDVEKAMEGNEDGSKD